MGYSLITKFKHICINDKHTNQKQLLQITTPYLQVKARFPPNGLYCFSILKPFLFYKNTRKYLKFFILNKRKEKRQYLKKGRKQLLKFELHEKQTQEGIFFQ